jgi:hypothetical protein
MAGFTRRLSANTTALSHPATKPTMVRANAPAPKVVGATASAWWLSPSRLSLGGGAPTAPVAVAKCPAYGPEVLTTLQTMFDQLGGLERLVKGKTVAVKLNMTGLADEWKRHGPMELDHWVHPQVIGAAVPRTASAR